MTASDIKNHTMLEQAVNVAGLIVKFRSDFADDIEYLSRVFRHHICQAVPADNAAHHLVEVLTADSIPDMPSDTKKIWEGNYRVNGDDPKPLTARWYRSSSAGMEYISLDNRTQWIINDMRSLCHTTIHLVTHADGNCRIRPLLRPMMTMINHVVFSMHNRFTIHASAIAYRGNGVIVTGRSGSGKSTLCYDLTRKGASYLGDDIVFLYLDDTGEPRIGSLLCNAKLFISRPDSKDFIDPLEETGGQPVMSAPASALMRVRQSGNGPSTLEPISPQELFTILMEQSNNMRIHHNPQAWLELCYSLLEKCHGYIMHFGNRELLDINILNNI